MDLLVVRHAVAMEREEWAPSGRPDSERPLTKPGRSQMKRCADGLASILGRLDVIATSPFARASATAGILAKAFPKASLVAVEDLASGGSRQKLCRWLESREEKRIAIVGHEPDLGVLIGWLVTGDAAKPLPLRKAGACLLRFREEMRPGEAELRWLVTPALLEDLG